MAQDITAVDLRKEVLTVVVTPLGRDGAPDPTKVPTVRSLDILSDSIEATAHHIWNEAGRPANCEIEVSSSIAMFKVIDGQMGPY